MTSPKIKTILELESIPLVELDFMNNTHFEEIEMVKELGKLVTSHIEKRQQQNISKLTQKLNAWLDHTVAHFERENELMEKTGFPAYDIHKSEHQIALDLMEDVITAWNENQDLRLVESYIFSAWPAWFDQHVNTMDMMTAKFAVMNGYTNH